MIAHDITRGGVCASLMKTQRNFTGGKPRQETTPSSVRSTDDGIKHNGARREKIWGTQSRRSGTIPSPRYSDCVAREPADPACCRRLSPKRRLTMQRSNKLAISINHPETSPMICPFQRWPGGIDRSHCRQDRDRLGTYRNAPRQSMAKIGTCN
jgi:hypothetical protein